MEAVMLFVCLFLFFSFNGNGLIERFTIDCFSNNDKQQKMLLHIVILLIGLFQVVFSSRDIDSFSVQTWKSHGSCDDWAHNDQECGNNPRFMWGACISSCLSPSLNPNQHSECDQWAKEGECVNNPRYLHIHCSHSCGDAASWSPWVRRDLSLDDSHWQAHILPSMGKDAIEVPTTVNDAAEVMRQRVNKYVRDGLHSVVTGLVSSAPTEYLGMLGLAEAIIYAMRMQELVMEYAGMGQALDRQRQVISNVAEWLQRGYSADLIYRPIQNWLNALDNSANEINEWLERIRVEGGRIDLSFERLAAQFAHMHVDYSLPATSTVRTDGNTLLLNNGIEMPRIGLGTWQLEGDDCETAVREAIINGFRFFDTAQAYRNEEALGRALANAVRDGLVKREDLFIASKISDESNAGRTGVTRLIELQMQDLQVDYIDLYMLHSPMGDKRLQRETWAAMEDLYSNGKIRALGVSNFDVVELKGLLATARVPPTVVQNKLDIYHIGKQMDGQGVNNLRFVMEHNMVLLAYSPFSAYPFMMQPLDEPIVRYLVHRRKLNNETVTPSQLVLKWMAQRGMAMIPRSSNGQRQKENFDALSIRSLSAEEMTLLDICQVLIGNPLAVAIELPKIGVE
jgi:diketogulonate reductase-like aldo/keto reductase